MANETNSSKIDERVKHSLSNYEAPYDPTDWATMESMLDASPQVSTFNWSYAIGFILVIALLAGVFFIYTKTDSSKTTITSPVIPDQQKIENTTIPETKPIIKSNQVSPAVSSPTVSKPITTPIPESPTLVKDVPEKSTAVEIAKKENTSKKEPESKEKIKNKKTERGSIKIEKDGDVNTHQDVPIMGTERVFGDTPDSLKGISGEKEESKKAAKKQAEYPIGWNNFMLSNVNPDSLKHYRERMKKDSIK